MALLNLFATTYLYYIKHENFGGFSSFVLRTNFFSRYNKMFIPFLTSLLFCSALVFTSAKDILLDTNNTLLLRGEINDKLATDFVFDLNRRTTKTELYVFLDTNGGSVDAGNKIVNEIRS